ncbi:MAG: DUF2219 family protein [Alphaproteobacteria bacterium]|nr:DUF2219 family protein [Alphaproteobacteria bacterium]
MRMGVAHRNHITNRFVISFYIVINRLENNMKKLQIFSFTYLAITLTCFTALAEDNEHQSYLSLSIENDLFGGGTDRFYTSGIRATWFNSRVDVPEGIDKFADKIPTFDLNDSTSTFFSIGQNIYTPEDITLSTQPDNDRPWAAFFYGSVGLATATQNESGLSHIDELEFTLGVIGPEALGEQTQKFVHKYISGSETPRGWSNQLDLEPAILISWQRRVPYAFSHDFQNFNARIEPNFSISLGNVRTNVGTGLMFVLGSSNQQDTPPRVRPAVPGTGVFRSERNKLDWQIFAGADGRLVGHDIFLDGNTFSDSHSVNKKHLVGDVSTGISFSYSDYRLSYTLNARSKEFDGQENESVFGSITLTKRF